MKEYELQAAASSAAKVNGISLIPSYINVEKQYVDGFDEWSNTRFIWSADHGVLYCGDPEIAESEIGRINNAIFAYS